MLLVVIIVNCEDKWPCLLSKGCRYKVQTQRILYLFMTWWLKYETTCLGTGSLFFFLMFFLYVQDVLAPFFSYQVAKCCRYGQYTVQQELESLLVGLDVIVQALHTNTSSVRSCLLQHLFIDCLVTLYDWVGIRRHTKTKTGLYLREKTRQMSRPVIDGRIKVRGLTRGTFSCLLLHSMRATFTHLPG